MTGTQLLTKENDTCEVVPVKITVKHIQQLIVSEFHISYTICLLHLRYSFTEIAKKISYTGLSNGSI